MLIRITHGDASKHPWNYSLVGKRDEPRWGACIIRELGCADAARIFVSATTLGRAGLQQQARSDVLLAGGEGGIRTHVRVAPKPDFESGAFDHSATSPGADDCEIASHEQSSARV
jgi:hypothetical protein